MKKGDLIERVRSSEEAFYDDIPMGAVGVVLKGPYEKNISDILYNERPWLVTSKVKYIILKRVVDIMFQDEIHKCCIVDDYERVKP